MGEAVRPRPDASAPAGERVALVLGGGGVAGALYEIGALRALDLVLADRSVGELDVYVGTSAGALIAALCASGIPTRELMGTVTREGSGPFRDIGARDLLSPNVGGLLRAAAGAPRRLASLSLAVARQRRELSLLDVALTLADGLPSGWCTGAGVERYVHGVLAGAGCGDDFRGLSRELYIAATDLETCERVVLGAGGLRDVPISLAVRASTALPMLYAPVRVGGRELVDGGVMSTTNLDIAVQAGAGLVLVVNPIVPFVRAGARVGGTNLQGGAQVGDVRPFGAEAVAAATEGVGLAIDPVGGSAPMADGGVGVRDGSIDLRGDSRGGLTRIGYQAFRLLAYQRLHEMARTWQERYPGVDIVLIEPRPDDELMAHTSIMSLSSRVAIARHGFESAKRQLAGDFDRLAAICERHGVAISPAGLQASLRGDEASRGGGAASRGGGAAETGGARAATTPSDGGRRATTASDGGRRATTASDGGRRATTASDGGRRATTPSDGGRRATTPSDGGRRATTPSDGGRRATTASDGGRRATTPSDGGRRATTPSDGGRRAG